MEPKAGSGVLETESAFEKGCKLRLLGWDPLLGLVRRELAIRPAEKQFVVGPMPHSPEPGAEGCLGCHRQNGRPKPNGGHGSSEDKEKGVPRLAAGDSARQNDQAHRTENRFFSYFALERQQLL